MPKTPEELLPIFREEFPEFSEKSDALVEMFLEKALLVHALCQMATVYLAAHLCVTFAEAKAGEEGDGAPIDSGGAREMISETAKSIATTYQAMTEAGSPDTFYASTIYGRMYIVLRDSCAAKKFSVRVR